MTNNSFISSNVTNAEDLSPNLAFFLTRRKQDLHSAVAGFLPVPLGNLWALAATRHSTVHQLAGVLMCIFWSFPTFRLNLAGQDSPMCTGNIFLGE